MKKCFYARPATPGSVAAAVQEVVRTIPEPFTIRMVLPLVKAHPFTANKSAEHVTMCASKSLMDLREKGVVVPAGPGRPTPYVRGRAKGEATKAMMKAIHDVVDRKIAALRRALDGEGEAP